MPPLARLAARMLRSPQLAAQLCSVRLASGMPMQPPRTAAVRPPTLEAALPRLQHRCPRKEVPRMSAPNLAPPERVSAAAHPARSPLRLSAAQQEASFAPPPLWKLLAVSLLLFLVVAEWLQPLPQLSPLTELYDIRPFLVVFGCALLLDGLRVPFGWGILLKCSLAIGLVGYLFYPDMFVRLSWLPTMTSHVREDVLLTLQGHYEQIGGETRTLLFAAGWCMMTSVVHALLIQRQQAMWLGGVTLLYLLLMQLIFGIDTTGGVLRSFLWTGLLLALLLPDRLMRTRGVPLPPVRALRWSAAALIPVILCAVLGWYGWKPDGAADRQQLMRPLDYSFLNSWPFQSQWPFIGGTAQAAAPAVSNLIAKTGYSTDDSFLGGPIQPDNTVAFEARTSELTYWRGESRSVYTGKGWQQTAAKLQPYRQTDTSAASGQQHSETATGIAQPDSAASTATADIAIISQEVTLPTPLATKLLFTGGPLLKADLLKSAQGSVIPPESLRYDMASDAYSLPELSDPAVYYRIEARKPQSDPAVLRQDRGPYPEDITDDNLQLPTELPERVRELARAITAQAANPYDKAAAIADYLRTQYRYSMSEPTTPAANEDFVDHFLFVDRNGYCDQFSTAMTVLLRAVGVPARWIKGYAPGTETQDTAADMTLPSPSQSSSPATPSSAAPADSLGQALAAPASSPAAVPGSQQPVLHTVVVRNRDAHSWVEVYFPGTGWVAFDPTPGFSGGTGVVSTDTGTGNAAAVGGSPSIVAHAQASTVIGATLGAAPASEPGVQLSLTGVTPSSNNGGSQTSTMLQNIDQSLHAWLGMAAALPYRGRLIAVLAAALAAVIALFFIARSKKMLLLLPLRTYPGSVKKPYQQELLLMNSLWRRLYRIYGGKAPHETMREYIARIHEADEERRTALTEFAGLYELTSYNPLRRRPVTRRTLRDLWRRMSGSTRRR
jgi:transglutaminase-like putative cysteine protease